MPWAAAAAVASSAIGYMGANKAAKGQQRAEAKALEAQERMYQQQREDFKPYMQAGYGALEGLQQLTDPTQRSQMLTEYYKSPEYAAMSDMSATEQSRLGAVTGGLRSGSTYQNLEAIRPQLGQSYLTNQYNQLTGLANLGMGATSQGAQAAGQFGNQSALAQRNMGQIYAQEQLAKSNAIGDALSAIGGVFI